jgi:hypothetical protein
MLDTQNRADPYRDLAEECRRLATSSPSSRMKNRYLVMAQDYMWLADLKEQAHADRTTVTVEENAAWAATITSPFSAPWRIVEIPHGFAVEDATGQQLAVFYGLAEPNTARQTDSLTIDEARQMAVDFAKLPAVSDLRLAETIPKFTSFDPDEWMPNPLLPQPSNVPSNRTRLLIAIAATVLLGGYFIFRNFDRPVDVAVVPQATTDIPPVEFSSGWEADAPSTKTTGIAVDGRAKPELQTAPLPVPLDAKPTEGDMRAGPPQMSPERRRQASTASRDDSCLASALDVRQNHPGAWPSWTLRAPGHEGTRCWYPTKRTTAATEAR